MATANDPVKNVRRMTQGTQSGEEREGRVKKERGKAESSENQNRKETGGKKEKSTHRFGRFVASLWQWRHSTCDLSIPSYPRPARHA